MDGSLILVLVTSLVLMQVAAVTPVEELPKEEELVVAEADNLENQPGKLFYELGYRYNKQDIFCRSQ